MQYRRAFVSRRDLLLHRRHGAPTPAVRRRRGLRPPPPSVPAGCRTTALHRQRHGRAPRPPALPVDPAAGRRRLPGPVAADQNVGHATARRPAPPLAAALLGTPDPGRYGLPPARRVHPLQPGEARLRVAPVAVAVFQFSALRQGGAICGGLGQQRNRYGRSQSARSRSNRCRSD